MAISYNVNCVEINKARIKYSSDPEYRRATLNRDIVWRANVRSNKITITSIKDVLRSRLNSAIKRDQKSGSAVKDLGCTIEELKLYLESQFEDNMSWDNHGEWHIDHIKPLASFDLTNEEELKKACNYTNLQPLWAKDNLKKGAKHG